MQTEDEFSDGLLGLPWQQCFAGGNCVAEKSGARRCREQRHAPNHHRRYSLPWRLIAKYHIRKSARNSLNR